MSTTAPVGCCYSAILSPLSYSGKMSPMNTREEIYHMTAKEMARLKVAEKLVEGKVTIKDTELWVESGSNIHCHKSLIK